MPYYDFECKTCHEVCEHFFHMSDVPGELECPTCGQSSSQHVAGRSFGIQIPNGWSDGKVVAALHPRDPARMVTSEKEMRKVYDKSGISMDTGQIYDEKKFEARKAKILANPGKRPHQKSVDRATKSKPGQGRLRSDKN